MKKKNLFAVILLILHICTTLSGQSWREVDFRTQEGYKALLDQYEHYDDLSSIEERFIFYKTGVQAALHHRDSAWIAQFAYRVASTASALDSIDTALEYIAIARSTIDQESDFAINIISYQGVLHKQAGDFEQALAYYEEALQLAREKFPDKAVMPLSNIATLYRSQKNYKETLEYLYQLDEIARELESPIKEYHLVYNNAEFCIAHKALNNLDSAANYAQLCIQNLDKLDKRLNMKTAGFAYITVAEFYIEKLQQPERAKPLLDSALLYTEGFVQTKVKVSLGKYYLAKGAFAEAGAVIEELNEADIQTQTTRLRVLELSEQYYTKIGDFEKALAFANDIKELEADRFNDEKARLTTFYSAKFENQKQQKEIQELQYRQRIAQWKYRTWITIFTLVSLLALCIAIFQRLQVRRKKKFADILQREVEVKTQDLKTVNELLADKVDKLNTFNYTVSHDLKAPLTSAFNFLDLIKLQASDLLDSSTRQLFGNLHGVLTHMKEMVEGVSLYLEADKLELQPVKISTETVTNDIFNQLKHYHPDHLKRYSFTIQSPLPDCYADPLLFRQAMTNLLSNAVKATRSANHPQIQVTGQKNNGKVILTVQDNGIGIPLQNRERLFELFKSVHTRDRFPGTGAGLAIVKRVVERHSGTTEAESAGEGKGASFTIRLPHAE